MSNIMKLGKIAAITLKAVAISTLAAFASPSTLSEATNPTDSVAHSAVLVERLDVKRAVEELNAYRAEHGLRPVTLDQKLIEASHIHSSDLAKAGIIAHKGTDGSTHGERIKRVGYNFLFAGENVATGQRSWESVFQAWKDSPSHNATLLHPDVSEFGIALVEDPSTYYRTYWTMLLTKPMDMSFLETNNIL